MRLSLAALNNSLRDLHEKILKSEEENGSAEESPQWQELIRQREARIQQLEKDGDEEARLLAGLERIQKRYDGLLSLLEEIDIGPHFPLDTISIMERASAAREFHPSFFGE